MTLVLALLLVNISVYAGHETQRYEYQQEQLANGLKLAVLSNTKLKRNHIAIRVAAGSLHEPLGFPGLAHLLEHLVFQYQLPKSSSSLRQWIQANGGQQNAHTNLEDTLYFFDVPPHDAALALNHWNHALQQLDYTPGAVKNELTTLTQEFALRARNRHWLHWDALKALSPATHPFKRLHPGNETSLARFGQKELRLALKSFQAKYYQTNRITLAISGPQSVEALLTLGRTAFSPKLREPPPTTQTHLGQFIDQHHLPATLKIKSDHRQVISLLFSLGDKAHTSDQQVFSYLQYLIQNPGKHSLLDTLRRQGLVTDLSSGIGINTKEQNTFHITFQTTDTGWKNPDRITTSVFRYIKLIQQQGLAEWRIKEFENLVRLRHLKAFNDWTPMDITLKMAECFSDLDSLLDATQLRHSLSVGFSADFRKISKALQPQNLISIHMDTNYSGKFLSPVFATSFDIFKNTNDDFLETLSNKTWPKKTVAVISPLQLPDAEPLVPQQWKLPVAANATAVPELILRDSQLEIWHGFDSEWNSPLAQVKLLFKQPIASLTIDKAVMTEILLLDAKTKLHHYRERLENLGYSFQLIRTSEGLMINIEGFTETLSEVMTPIVNALQNPYIEKQYVAALGEQLKNHWRTEARYGFEELFF
ncbi:MAG: insulinase family protein, partial [Pseudomonadales bacterium]|nr:insulinase family protein [Pseudomonadales bacterium]